MRPGRACAALSFALICRWRCRPCFEGPLRKPDFFRSTGVCSRVQSGSGRAPLTTAFFNYSHAADSTGWIGNASTSCGAAGAITALAFVRHNNYVLPKAFRVRSA